MDNIQNYRAVAASSAQSTINKFPEREATNRVPPVPLPKPKMKQVKECKRINNERDENNAGDDVRRTILKGSRNPTGSSSGNNFGSNFLDQPLPKGNSRNVGLAEENLLSPNFRFEIQNTKSDKISLNDKATEWNSQKLKITELDEGRLPHKAEPSETHLFQERSNVAGKNFNEADEKWLHNKNRDWKPQNLKAEQGPRANFYEKKQESEEHDSEYLMPRLERQSNQVLILAENNPIQLKDDIVRNCDVLEENIPGSGHTGNLLRYWEKVETSPEKESIKDDQNRNVTIVKVGENSSIDKNPCVIMEINSPNINNKPKDVFEMQRSICSEELNNEKILDDILQEFENFNKDIFDMKVTTDEGAVAKPKFEKNGCNLEQQCTLPKYESLPGEKVEDYKFKEFNEANNRQSYEESVYYELDAVEPPIQVLRNSSRSIHELDSGESSSQVLRNSSSRSIHELEPQNVTLIGYRRLNEDEQDPEKISNTIGSVSSSPCTPEALSLKSASFLAEDSGSFRDGDIANKKKNASKQRCLLM